MGSANSNKSDSRARGANQASTFIDPNQQQHLNNLWDASSQQIHGGAGSVNQAQSQAAINRMGANPFAGQLQSFSDPNNAMVAQNIDRLNTGLMSQFNEQLMPAIASNSIQGGQFGGGRQGVAEGIAAGKVADAFAGGSADIMNNAYSMANQATQFGSQYNLMQNQGVLSGLGQQQQQQLLPMQVLAQILGNPTVLSQSSGTNKSNAGSEGFGLSIMGG